MTEPVGSDLTPDLLAQDDQRQEAELDRLYSQLGTAPAAPPPPVPEDEQFSEKGIRWDLLAKDTKRVVTNLRELPERIALGGIRDATQGQLNAFAEFIDWTSESAARGEWGGLLAAAYFPPIAKAAMAKKQGEVETVSAEEVLPDIPDPTTPEGQMARSVIQFSTAFVAPFKGLQSAGMGSLAASMVAGAIADGTAFDPHQERLANLIQEYPALANPVTEFLQSKPTDSKALGRFKNAVEGIGLGLASEGLIRGVNIIRQSRAVKGVTAPIQDVAGTAPVTPEHLRPLGDMNAPPVQAVEVDDALRSKIKQAAKEAVDLPPGSLLEADGGRGVYINWARIDEDDSIKQVIQTVADLHKTSVDEARRGVQTQEATRALADAMNMSVDDVLARNTGEARNAEWMLAARKLWATSAKNVESLILRADGPGASMVDKFNARRGLVLHHAIQKEVLGARTEVARATASWKIPAGSGEDMARGIKSVMDSYGGVEITDKLISRLAAASRAGVLDERTIGEVAKRGALARTWDMVQEAWINGLLSNPVTHAVNAMSNTGVAVNSIIERAVAGRGAQAMGSTDGVVVGEAGQMLVGMVEGIKDNWRALATHNRLVGAVKKAVGAPGRIPDEGIVFRAPGLDMSKIDSPFREAISAENMGLQSDTLLGKVADGFGAAVRSPGTGLQGSDQMFKTLGYRMELHAQAFRKATREGLEGVALKRRAAELVANPTEQLRMAAVDNALYQTFTQPLGNMGQWLMKGRNSIPGGFLLLPFVRTPANILKYSFSRTPLAPLGAGVRADMAAGGAKAQLAWTRIGLGTAAQLTALDMVYSGVLSGGGPPDRKSRDALLRTNWQPYSLKVGDRWYSYQRVDPLNTVLGTAADLGEFTMWSGRELEDPELDMGEIYSAGVMALGNTLINKTYLSSTADAMQAVRDPDRARGFVTRLAGSVVPAGVAQAARINDPYLLEVRTMLDAVKSRIPGWSKDVPVSRDLWGRPIEYKSGLGAIYDAVSPIYSRREKPSPIDSEMLRLNVGVDKPGRSTSFNGVTVNLEQYPKAYDRYVELAGNGLKDPAYNLGAQDYLDAVVQGKIPEAELYKRLTDGPDGMKADFIHGVIGNYREMARAKLLEEFPDLSAMVDRKRAQQQAKELQAVTR